MQLCPLHPLLIAPASQMWYHNKVNDESKEETIKKSKTIRNNDKVKYKGSRNANTNCKEMETRNELPQRDVSQEDNKQINKETKNKHKKIVFGEQ